jgi:iron complex transport system ATP-binding protein
MFSVKHLSVECGQQRLVNQLSFTVNAGERWVVLGENGCGKSNLLNACAGIASTGRSAAFEQLSFGGHRFTSHTLKPQVLSSLRSYCPQRLDWNLQLTPMQLAGLLHVNTAALGLPHQWMTAPVSQRSGGEQQRIAIALTTAQAPALCFLDEPLTHLDEVQQVQCLTQLKATGKALVMVSHHIRLSLAWATHALLPAGNGAWLAGEVASVCQTASVAVAYGISEHEAQRLLTGQLNFQPF